MGRSEVEIRTVSQAGRSGSRAQLLLEALGVGVCEVELTTGGLGFCDERLTEFFGHRASDLVDLLGTGPARQVLEYLQLLGNDQDGPVRFDFGLELADGHTVRLRGRLNGSAERRHALILIENLDTLHSLRQSVAQDLTAAELSLDSAKRTQNADTELIERAEEEVRRAHATIKEMISVLEPS